MQSKFSPYGPRYLQYMHFMRYRMAFSYMQYIGDYLSRTTTDFWSWRLRRLIENIATITFIWCLKVRFWQFYCSAARTGICRQTGASRQSQPCSFSCSTTQQSNPFAQKSYFSFTIFLKLKYYGAKQAGSRKRITPKANQKLNSKCDHLGCLTSLWWRLWSKRN